MINFDEPIPMKEGISGQNKLVVNRPLPRWEDTASPLERHQNEVRKLAQHSTKSVEHYTPSAIIEAARALMGGIDLDPASTDLANETVKAATFYGYLRMPDSEPADHTLLKDYRCQRTFVDGLVKQWRGKVWLNSPGGKTKDMAPHLSGISKSYAAIWWGKLWSDWNVGHVEQAVFLGFTLELLVSIQRLKGVGHPLDYPVCVPSSRVKFDYPTETQDGLPTHTSEVKASTQPTHGNFIVWLPPKDEHTRMMLGSCDRCDKGEHHVFAEHFSKFGVCK